MLRPMVPPAMGALLLDSQENLFSPLKKRQQQNQPQQQQYAAIAAAAAARQVRKQLPPLYQPQQVAPSGQAAWESPTQKRLREAKRSIGSRRRSRAEQPQHLRDSIDSSVGSEMRCSVLMRDEETQTGVATQQRLDEIRHSSTRSGPPHNGGAGDERIFLDNGVGAVGDACDNKADAGGSGGGAPGNAMLVAPHARKLVIVKSATKQAKKVAGTAGAGTASARRRVFLGTASDGDTSSGSPSNSLEALALLQRC